MVWDQQHVIRFSQGKGCYLGDHWKKIGLACNDLVCSYITSCLQWWDRISLPNFTKGALRSLVWAPVKDTGVITGLWSDPLLDLNPKQQLKKAPRVQRHTVGLKENPVFWTSVLWNREIRRLLFTLKRDSTQVSLKTTRTFNTWFRMHPILLKNKVEDNKSLYDINTTFQSILWTFVMHTFASVSCHKVIQLVFTLNV